MADQSARRKGQAKGRRRGDVFPLRVTAAERAKLEAMQRAGGGPRALGPWLLWRALGAGASPVIPDQVAPPVIPELVPQTNLLGNTGSSCQAVAICSACGDVLTAAPPGAPLILQEWHCRRCSSAIASRVILDLCGGTGAWSEPYKARGYDVRVLTLPENDVRTWEPPPGLTVWGVLAAPPCDQFSLARNGYPDRPRDFAGALEVVCGCLRIIALVRPVWWALENPTGHLGRWLGTPRDVWEPCDFGDPWTKRTALWGSFTLPTRGPFVTPVSGAPQGSYDNRARTPPGFARAFCEANP